ncbi:hypothetical protein PR202_ga23973 [Eleusine coracana subsp. coracana]|uniref:UBA domain-containing protein n=1 Tax=Eleusine coracana subsp. coracana TaxID=191504 RepID=A0AAV5D6I4_ELECO|nr:hypothetical protein PR202_ga23973 [Eleusine coracana subsp. coracana]
MQGGVSGFPDRDGAVAVCVFSPVAENAPVNRAVVLTSGLLSIVFSSQRRSRALGISYQVFCLFSITVSSLLEILSLVLLKDTNYISSLASGPYGLIFASFVPFFLDIPVTSRFRVFGLNFSDKSFIYLAGLQLLLSSWKHSLIPGVFGLVAGSLYRLNVFGIRKMKFSLKQNQSSTGFAATIEPPESSVAMLVSMGFDGNAARQALMRARNDINAATNILLESQAR